MIKVNLIGTGHKKSVTKTSRIALPTNAMPFLLAAVVLGSIAGGYLWYSSLTSQNAEMDNRISSLQAQKAALEAVIKQDQVYETRKKALENRIRVVENLKRNQVNPIMALDIVSESIERTQYVWLTQLEQNNALISMAGIGTSVNAIADFVTNLQNSRYFRSVELNNATDSAGNFTFSLKCEFAPPVAARPAGGGN